MPAATLAAPSPARHALSGRQLAARRIALGVSRKSVAHALHVHDVTLERIEQSSLPLGNDHAEAYQRALSAALVQRLQTLQRAGLTLRDVPAVLRPVLTPQAVRA